MSAPRLTLDEAKRKLDVAVLWRALSLPGEPGKSCRCPLHQDKQASFSVFVGRRGGLRWKCFGGCGQGGPVELLARVLDINEREACRRLLEMAGGNMPLPDAIPRQQRTPHPPRARRLVLPVGLHHGTPAELATVAGQRDLSFAGISLASARGLLWFAAPRGCASWIITDEGRVNAQARKMDGSRWPHIGDVKAWTLLGSRASWPIGTREAVDCPFVALVEGGPDLLAACHFIMRENRESDVAAVAILGASNHIPPDALGLLTGKTVRIFPHIDPAGQGQDAALRWAGQLERAGCSVDLFSFEGLKRADGALVGDLNDFAYLDPACLAAERADLERIMPQ